jgi:hypothetical protein
VPEGAHLKSEINGINKLQSVLTNSELRETLDSSKENIELKKQSTILPSNFDARV